MPIPQIILWLFAAYLGAGLAVGVPFVVRGISRVDHSAHDAPWSFRLIILPGTVALWPLVLHTWRTASGHDRKAP